MLRGASLSCQDRGVQPLPLRALLLTLAATSLAAFSPPVDAFIVDYASTPGAVPADDTYSGNSYITPERFPCPDNFKLITENVEVIYGPNVLSQRQQTEIAYLNATTAILVPAGVCNRWINYTAHPSQTPGLENFTAMEQHLYEYVDNQVGTRPLDAQTDNQATTALESYVASDGYPSKVYIQWFRVIYAYYENNTLPLNVTTIDIADIKSTIMLTGQNLVPFTFDKQVLFIDTILGLFLNDNIPVALANFSDWRAAEAATSISDSATQAAGIDTILVDVWTSLIPPNDYTPDTVWSTVAAPNPRIWEKTGAYNVSMNMTYINATQYLSLEGALLAEVTTWPQHHGGSHRYWIWLGILLGGVVLLLMVGVALACRMTRRRAARISKELELTASTSDNSPSDLSKFSDLERGVYMDKLGSNGSGTGVVRNTRYEYPADDEIDPAEITICKRPDGSDWCLGGGQYGKVYKALRHGITEVAVKMVSCVADDASTLQLMRKEIAILKHVSFDPHIVQFFGACTTEPAMLVMEYMEGGDLREAIWRDIRQGTSEYDWYNKGKDVALAVARGLHFLHRNGVVHRDVKASNILLSQDCCAKITDMGLSKAEYFSSSTVFPGTFMYAAPEVLMGQPSNEKADTFSYGVVLWELITKEQTERGNWRDVVVPDECPAGVEVLLKDCLTNDVERRPSMKEVVERLTAIDAASKQLAHANFSSIAADGAHAASAGPRRLQ